MFFPSEASAVLILRGYMHTTIWAICELHSHAPVRRVDLFMDALEGNTCDRI